MKRPMNRSPTPNRMLDPRRRGFVYIWVALLGLVLIGFLGLAVDAGYMIHTGNQLQNAAEAAALAAAQELGDGEVAARDKAMQVSPLNSAGGVPINLDRNTSNSPGGDIVVGKFDPQTRLFTPATQDLNAVKVTARRTSARNGGVSLFFGAAFGVGSADVTRSAVAVQGGSHIPAILVLNPTVQGAMTSTGNGLVDVSGGSIQVNSNHPRALVLTGSASVQAQAIDVVGSFEMTGAAQAHPDPHAGAPLVPDPLA